MKKALVLALCVVGFILIAAPTAVERAPLFVNGKQIGEAVLINGMPAASMETVAKAGGATMTLQPFFSRQGTKFLAVATFDMVMKKAVAPAEKQSPTEVPAVQAGMIKQDVAATKGFQPAPGQAFRVGRTGEISGKVFEFEGKAYVPLADFARALGMNTWTGTVQSGKPVQLHSSANGILIGL